VLDKLTGTLRPSNHLLYLPYFTVVCAVLHSVHAQSNMMGYEQLAENMRGIMGHLIRYLVQASPCIPHVPIPFDSFEQMVTAWKDDWFQTVRDKNCHTVHLQQWLTMDDVGSLFLFMFMSVTQGVRCFPLPLFSSTPSCLGNHIILYAAYTGCAVHCRL
jgi:hypothetical protein